MVGWPLAALDLNEHQYQRKLTVKEAIPCFNSRYECNLPVLYLHKNAGRKFLGNIGVSFAN
jgi:hypothetical protein